MSRSRTSAVFLLASIFLLAPCFWQPRIFAGDLSSHIYNAWLARLISAGKAPGLAIVPQTTNVLFDLALAGLLRSVGAAWAQRIAVSAAVLIFVWGAFFFVERLSGRRSWPLLPVLAVLAYGWTFHMGFFNMYVSLGLCLWALAAAWDGKLLGLAAAAALLAVAYVAHGLPVAWAVAVGLYAWAVRRLPEKMLPPFLGIAAGAIVLLRVFLETLGGTRWMRIQVLSATGLNQALVYDRKYAIVALGLLFLWMLLFYSRFRSGGGPLRHSVPFHIAFLTAVGIAVLPTSVSIPGMRHSLAFIAERMSLPLGVTFCAVGAQAPISRLHRGWAIALALAYFAFLAHDDAALNRFEDRVSRAVVQVPGQRVLSGFNGEGFWTDQYIHMVDRACLGLCYSYADYEPSTYQFRVRALRPNPFVAASYGDSWLMQVGRYIVRPSDLPIYRVDVPPAGPARLVPLAAGQPNGSVSQAPE